MRLIAVPFRVCFGIDLGAGAAWIGRLYHGLENRRWATILEFESLRFRHIQSPDYSGLFAFLGCRLGLHSFTDRFRILCIISAFLLLWRSESLLSAVRADELVPYPHHLVYRPQFTYGPHVIPGICATGTLAASSLDLAICNHDHMPRQCDV